MYKHLMKDDGKWKKLCLLLAIAFFTNFTYGQIRISGKIVNPSGLTVESVAVTVKEPNLVAWQVIMDSIILLHN